MFLDAAYFQKTIYLQQLSLIYVLAEYKKKSPSPSTFLLLNKQLFSSMITWKHMEKDANELNWEIKRHQWAENRIFCIFSQTSGS